MRQLLNNHGHNFNYVLISYERNIVPSQNQHYVQLCTLHYEHMLWETTDVLNSSSMALFHGTSLPTVSDTASWGCSPFICFFVLVYLNLVKSLSSYSRVYLISTSSESDFEAAWMVQRLSKNQGVLSSAKSHGINHVPLLSIPPPIVML